MPETIVPPAFASTGPSLWFYADLALADFIVRAIERAGHPYWAVGVACALTAVIFWRRWRHRRSA